MLICVYFRYVCVEGVSSSKKGTFTKSIECLKKSQTINNATFDIHLWWGTFIQICQQCVAGMNL